MKITDTMALFWGNADVFSNWHHDKKRPVQFTVEGIGYNCSEQYMMRMKAVLFGDLVAEAKIMATMDPRRQKELGREVQGYVDSVWKANARDLMLPGIIAKFEQNPDFLKVLLDPRIAGKLIVEASPYDKLWGVGLAEDDPRINDQATWQGTNWLGDVLMRARDRLQSGRARYCLIRATTLEQILETCDRHIKNIAMTKMDMVQEGDITKTDEFYCDMFRDTWKDLREDVQAMLDKEKQHG